MSEKAHKAMLTIAEALEAVLDAARPLRPRSVPIDDALGLVLAGAVAADLDSPPFDRVMVDGYAVRASDFSAVPVPVRLTVVEDVPAGRVPTRVIAPSQCAFILTGAPLPQGADAVVMLEIAHRDGDHVELPGPVRFDQNIMRRGREYVAGDVLIEPGAVLTPACLSIAAACGAVHVEAVPRPRIAVVSTGDELVDPSVVPGPGQVRNSNATLLMALARGEGAQPRRAETARDEAAHLRSVLIDALRDDVVLITGGVSAGTRDLVPEALEALGVRRVFHKVQMKPGKPLWFGVGPDRTDGRPSPLVFGLPGNPVSALVGFLKFVRPALAILSGHRPDLHSRQAMLSAPCIQTGDRPRFHPCRLVGFDDRSGLPLAEPLPSAGSADLRTAAQADGFLLLPSGDARFEPGATLEWLACR
jgi:molybdopterin molybdotransferase